MKKYLPLLWAALVAAACTCGCATPDEEFLHDDCTIHTIYMISPLSSTALQVQGEIIEQEDGTADIRFVIANLQRSFWMDEDGNYTPVKLQATVGYDAFVTPSLLGLKDLIYADEPLEVTVTAAMTGRSKTYRMTASVERK